VEEPAATETMKLVDVEEAPPPAPKPVPKARPPAVKPAENTPVSPVVAENTMTSTTAPAASSAPQETASANNNAASGNGAGEAINFLPMSKITKLPQFPEAQIRANVVYPPIALRAGIEGVVYLELFVDAQGNVRDIHILREKPEGRGFGEAATNAFRGIKAVPAEADGKPAAVRYRYPVRFKIK
jgi:protein TonB